jgi:hypothetical protein
VTYPREDHTAVLARWTNMFGFTMNPGRTKVIWSADGASADKWEAWSLSTRTNISSGTLSAAPLAILGQNTFALTDDDYLYLSGGTLGAERLIRYSNLGAGPQEDMGATNNGGGFSPPGVHCIGVSTAMKAADGNTYIGVISYSSLNNGYLFCHNTPSTPPVLLDTLASTGQSWQIKWFIRDGHGDIWALGGRGDLTSSQLAFWRVLNASGIVRTNYFVATMPAAQSGGIAEVWGCHVVTGAADHFIVSWPDTGTAVSVTVEYNGTVAHNTSALGNSPYFEPPAMALCPVTAGSLWVDAADASTLQFSTTDLSLTATWAFSLWGLANSGKVQQGTVFDVANNALIAGYMNADQTFGWLFFPRANRHATVRRIDLRLKN